MESRPSVELRVGGQTFRVVGSASSDELQRLARIVDGKLREVSTSTAFHPQSMLLVAMTLAHELEQERARRRDVEQRSREALTALLERIDQAIEGVDAEETEAETTPTLPVASDAQASPL